MTKVLAPPPHKVARPALVVLALLSGTTIATSPSVVAASGVHAPQSTSYVFFSPGGQSTTMSGSSEDMRYARTLRVGSEGLLYIRDHGRAYVIRDAATLGRVRSIFRPQEVLGAQQTELGRRQSALGRRQGELGAEQGRLGRLQADASPRHAGELSRQQAALGQRQAELGTQQAALGRQQATLGQEQARLGRLAIDRIRTLLAEAVQRGVAQRVN